MSAWCLCGVVDDRGDGTCGNCGRPMLTDPAEKDAPEPICAEAYCGERAYCSEAGECLAASVIPSAVPATPDAGDASECDGCQKRPCVCETVVLSSAEGLSEADLIDVIEAGWEDEPTAAEQELARIVARNVLASDWLAAREAAARTEERERIAQAMWHPRNLDTSRPQEDA